MNKSHVPHVVIVGAGFGGLTLAAELNSPAERGQAKVTLIERNDAFSMGFSMQWVFAGRRQPHDGYRPYSSLAAPHVQFMKADISAIDSREHQIFAGSRVIPYDILVLATGAELRPDLLPGLSEAAFNLCDQDSVILMRQAVHTIQGGTIAILVASTPFKCPPMPYEYAFLIDEILRVRGMRDKTRLVIATPEPQPMPVAGKAIGDRLKGMLAERDIEYLPEHPAASIDASGHVINFQNGARLQYDILGAIAPHRAPRIVLESGLAGPSGFVTVSLETLQTSDPDVYAVGDVASLTLPQGKPHPKAGVFAEAQARAVAQQIIARIGGTTASPYDAAGVCYVEVGYDQAAAAESNLLAPGGPQVTMQAPSVEGLENKRKFEQERFARWFTLDAAVKHSS